VIWYVEQGDCFVAARIPNLSYETHCTIQKNKHKTKKGSAEALPFSIILKTIFYS